MTGVGSNDSPLYRAAEGYPRYNPQQAMDAAETTGPDLSIEPIRTSTTVVPRSTWEGWVQNATATNRIAKRSAILVGISVACLAAVAGAALLPSRFVATTAIYAPLLGWLFGYLARLTIRGKRLRDTVAQMRLTLAPAEISLFESRVLESVLANRRVSAGREDRLVIVDTDDVNVKLNVVEYDMSKVEPYFYPSAGGGLG